MEESFPAELFIEKEEHEMIVKALGRMMLTEEYQEDSEKRQDIVDLIWLLNDMGDNKQLILKADLPFEVYG